MCAYSNLIVYKAIDGLAGDLDAFGTIPTNEDLQTDSSQVKQEVNVLKFQEFTLEKYLSSATRPVNVVGVGGDV